MAAALGLELNSERYVELLRKLIGETEHLQNNPPRFIPEEDRLVLHTCSKNFPIKDIMLQSMRQYDTIIIIIVLLESGQLTMCWKH